MTYAECADYMKNFFEQYYDKLSRDEIGVMLPLEESDREMWSEDADPNEEWKKWKTQREEICSCLIFQTRKCLKNKKRLED